MLNDEDIKVITGHLDRIATALELKAENINMHQEKRLEIRKDDSKMLEGAIGGMLGILTEATGGMVKVDEE